MPNFQIIDNDAELVTFGKPFESREEAQTELDAILANDDDLALPLTIIEVGTKFAALKLRVHKFLNGHNFDGNGYPEWAAVDSIEALQSYFETELHWNAADAADTIDGLNR